MFPSPRSFHISNPLLAVMAIVITASTNLTGCAAQAVLHAAQAAQFVPTAIVGYQLLPGDAEVELANPGKGVLASGLSNVKSVLTDNTYSKEYLENEAGLFSKVTLAKKAPVSTAGAARMARDAGHDAFFMVDTGGKTAQGGFTVKIVYGSATVTLVDKAGTVLYKQTATLKGKANSAQDISERQVAEALAKAIIGDLKASQTSKTADTSKPEGQSSGLLSKVKNIFD